MKLIKGKTYRYNDFLNNNDVILWENDDYEIRLRKNKNDWTFFTIVLNNNQDVCIDWLNKVRTFDEVAQELLYFDIDIINPKEYQDRYVRTSVVRVFKDGFKHKYKNFQNFLDDLDDLEDDETFIYSIDCFNFINNTFEDWEYDGDYEYIVIYGAKDTYKICTTLNGTYCLAQEDLDKEEFISDVSLDEVLNKLKELEGINE